MERAGSGAREYGSDEEGDFVDHARAQGLGKNAAAALDEQVRDAHGAESGEDFRERLVVKDEG